MNTGTQKTPLILWPFKAMMDLISGIIGLSGRLVAAAIGLAFMITGAVLTALVITAPLGVPMFAFGFLLMLRGIF